MAKTWRHATPSSPTPRWSCASSSSWTGTGSKNIRNPEELTKLDDLIKEFQATPREEVVTIVGHTDKLGSWEHNVVLSENRADTIKNYMVNKGYPESAIRSVKGVAWEGGNDVAADGATIDLGPLENNPLRRRVVVTELGPDQLNETGKQ